MSLNPLSAGQCFIRLSDFYKHKQMADGHLNKCKECAKKRRVNKSGSCNAMKPSAEYEYEMRARSARFEGVGYDE